MSWEEVFDDICKIITQRQKKRRDEFKNIIFFKNYKESSREYCQYCNVYFFRSNELSYQLCDTCHVKYIYMVNTRKKKTANKTDINI
jgi:hypothetical protein